MGTSARIQTRSFLAHTLVGNFCVEIAQVYLARCQFSTLGDHPMKFIDKLRRKRNNSVASKAVWKAKWEANLDRAARSAINEIPIARRQQLLDDCIKKVFAKGMPGLKDESPFK